MKPLTISAVTGRCILRGTQERKRELERLLYRRYPEHEWGTFFTFGFRHTRWGLLACLVDLIPPADGDLDAESGIVEFRPKYIRRALKETEKCPLGVGFIHSHPEGSRVSPSNLDDDMDRYFSEEFERYGGGKPYVSLIAERHEDGQRSFSGRAFDRGLWMPVEHWYTVGDDEIRKEVSQSFGEIAVRRDPSLLERAIQLLGSDNINRIARAKLGIVGCSGLGTPAAHVLARAGIEDFVLVDKGKFKPSNHERNHASRATDLDGEAQYKVDLLARLILEVNPRARIRTIVGDVLDSEVLDQLLECDLALGCTDSTYARAALGDISQHYILPVLDMAVHMRAEHGRLLEQIAEVAKYAPNFPCPWCRKRVNAAAIREETMRPEEAQSLRMAAEKARARGEDGDQYWAGERPSELTVGYMTTAVAAIGAGYAQHWLTGAGTMPHSRFQFDLGAPEFGFVKDNRARDKDCTCGRFIGYADQAASERTVTRPSHW